VVEGLSHAITEARRTGRLKGINVGVDFMITHLVFIIDVLVFKNGTLSESRAIQEIMCLIKKLRGWRLMWKNWYYVLMVWMIRQEWSF
jgi:hypothetical protein